MSNKLIDLDALSEYKDNADLKYQNKLTAGNCFSIVSNVISAKPTYVGQITTGSQSSTIFKRLILAIPLTILWKNIASIKNPFKIVVI